MLRHSLIGQSCPQEASEDGIINVSLYGINMAKMQASQLDEIWDATGVSRQCGSLLFCSTTDNATLSKGLRRLGL